MQEASPHVSMLAVCTTTMAVSKKKRPLSRLMASEVTFGFRNELRDLDDMYSSASFLSLSQKKTFFPGRRKEETTRRKSPSKPSADNDSHDNFGILPIAKLNEIEGFQCMGHSNWTICRPLHLSNSEIIPSFSPSYWEANSYYPRGPIMRKGDSSKSKNGWDWGVSVPWAFKLDH